ncbi:serine hydrolase domain-containing protein [Paenibacillus cymbidii]|uniref:serine hydrolase domain-containing protein n=1 Tax=Paenibacillus cymbidii TaxID=1639034 RepID=UPI001081B3CE|nr:serine hydrolase domain-containing protein [Paenibacillus cymbidii]
MDIQKRMQDLLSERVLQGDELGIQFAAYYEGELIVNVWAGIADSRTGQQVDGTTLFPAFSTTKGVAATVIHRLVERGELEYDMPIGELWPEFATHGKERATIGQALHHTLGIPYMPLNVEYEGVTDWDGMCSKIAQLAPIHHPGIEMHYHAMTYGYVIGEIARRITGKAFGQLVEEEVCRPLGIDDLYIGIPEEAEQRVAILEQSDLQSASTDFSPDKQPVPPAILPLHEWMNRTDARRACIPASNGIMTARAVARHYAALLPGGIDGVELLRPESVKRATLPLQLPDGTLPRVSLGYQLFGNGNEHFPVFGHGGYGGSIAFADPNHRLAVGLVINRLTINGSAQSVVKELRRLLFATEE